MTVLERIAWQPFVDFEWNGDISTYVQENPADFHMDLWEALHAMSVRAAYVLGITCAEWVEARLQPWLVRQFMTKTYAALRLALLVQNTVGETLRLESRHEEELHVAAVLDSAPSAIATGAVKSGVRLRALARFIAQERAEQYPVKVLPVQEEELVERSRRASLAVALALGARLRSEPVPSQHAARSLNRQRCRPVGNVAASSRTGITLACCTTRVSTWPRSAGRSRAASARSQASSSRPRGPRRNRRGAGRSRRPRRLSASPRSSSARPRTIDIAFAA